MFRVNKVRRNCHQRSTPRVLRQCSERVACIKKRSRRRSTSRLYDRSASGCPSFDSEARWLDPSRAITALSRRLAASTPPSTSASLIMNLATASRLVSSLGPIPEDVCRVLKGFSHVRDSFPGQSWPLMSEVAVGLNWHPVAPMLCAKHTTGHRSSVIARQAHQLAERRDLWVGRRSKRPLSLKRTDNPNCRRKQLISFIFV